jgi:hypothetical protein
MTAGSLGMAVVMAATLAGACGAQRRLHEVQPVLDFPEAGIDDSASYRDYKTRFYRDSKGNVLQIYLRLNEGRVVNLWADAANESIGFTARDSAGAPASLTWGASEATTSDSAGMRVVTYRLTSNTPHLRLGWFLLGTMRVERDFQYWRKHLEPFTAPPFHLAELDSLVSGLATLTDGEQRRELALLDARNLDELRTRLEPRVRVTRSGGRQIVLVTQSSIDAKNVMALEIGVESARATAHLDGRAVAIDASGTEPVQLTIRVATDAAALTPLTRAEIFDPKFLAFADSVKRSEPRLERQLRSVELLSTRQKLMAGLPNFATYFGRDQMMSSLMMQSVWTPAMMEHVIGSVLRKLAPDGEVSHEEALAGQAIRENAMVYVHLLDSSRALASSGDARQATAVLAQARGVLANLERVRENYHMIDDEFQLPVLVSRYLADPRLSADAKRAFLRGAENGTSRLALLAKELEVVAKWSAPYVATRDVTNLVGFAARDSTHWESESWRDSGAGYANGRYAMDINAIWVPMALDAIGDIIGSLRGLGLASGPTITGITAGPTLARYLADSSALQTAERAWGGAVQHFIVRLSSAEASERVRAKLGSLPDGERAYWQGVLSAADALRDSVTFLALSLDSAGTPIPVMNTDPATALFLADLSGRSLGPLAVEPFRNIDPFVRPYPAGLFVARLGPLVANDAYASPEVWSAFEHDQYHSPRVVWGREVNLITLGLAHQIAAAVDERGQPRDSSLAPYVASLTSALRRIQDAVEASGLRHAELWSYRIENGTLVPSRYGTASDVQLWNTTALAVRWALAHLPDGSVSSR